MSNVSTATTDVRRCSTSSALSHLLPASCINPGIPGLAEVCSRTQLVFTLYAWYLFRTFLWLYYFQDRGHI